MKQQEQNDIFMYHQCREKWRMKWRMKFLFLLLFGVGLGGCGGTDDTSPSTMSSPTFVAVAFEETDWSSPITVDVSPAKKVSLNNITVHGLNNLREYRVTYHRFDGSHQVPAPIVMKVPPTMQSWDNGALTLREVVLLTQNALSTPPLSNLIETKETLTLGTTVELFGEDGDGKTFTGMISLSLACSDE